MTHEFMPAKDLIILGGGLIEISPGEYELSEVSEQRAARAADYYEQCAGRLREGFRILTTGAASRVYSGHVDIPEEYCEAILTSQRLVEYGVPGSMILAVAKESDTTTRNFTDAVEEGVLKPDDYDREHPLLITTHRNHLLRARRDAYDVGIAHDALTGVYPAEEDGVTQEFIARGVRRAFYLGVRRGDLGMLRRRSDLLSGFLSSLAAIKRV